MSAAWMSNAPSRVAVTVFDGGGTCVSLRFSAVTCPVIVALAVTVTEINVPSAGLNWGKVAVRTMPSISCSGKLTDTGGSVIGVGVAFRSEMASKTSTPGRSPLRKPRRAPSRRRNSPSQGLAGCISMTLMDVVLE